MAKCTDVLNVAKVPAWVMAAMWLQNGFLIGGGVVWLWLA